MLSQEIGSLSIYIIEVRPTFRSRQIHDVQVRLTRLSQFILGVNPDLEHVVTARRVRIDTIVLEHSFLARVDYLVEELLRAVHLDPGLSKACLLITNIFDLNVSLLARIVISVEQVANIFAIDF